MAALEAVLAAARAPGAPADAAKRRVAQADTAALCGELQAALQTPQAKVGTAGPRGRGEAAAATSAGGGRLWREWPPPRQAPPVARPPPPCHAPARRAAPSPREQDTLAQLLQATRPATTDDPAAAAAATALRSAVAARLVGWLHALPADQGARVKDVVLVAMAELEHLSHSDRLRVASTCLAGFEEGGPHAAAALELVPPCLLLIPPGAPEGASQGGGRCAADAVDGGGAPMGTPPAEPSLAHRWGPAAVPTQCLFGAGMTRCRRPCGRMRLHGAHAAALANAPPFPTRLQGLGAPPHPAC
jgi:hypothetical protein